MFLFLFLFLFSFLFLFLFLFFLFFFLFFFFFNFFFFLSITMLRNDRAFYPDRLGHAHNRTLINDNTKQLFVLFSCSASYRKQVREVVKAGTDRVAQVRTVRKRMYMYVLTD
eukprot:COSAG06_NODE_1399_length_9580_cov_24.435292_6_plen_112_part_00